MMRGGGGARTGEGIEGDGHEGATRRGPGSAPGPRSLRRRDLAAPPRARPVPLPGRRRAPARDPARPSRALARAHLARLPRAHGVRRPRNPLDRAHDPLPARSRRIALASFLAYVLSHNVGLSFLSGSAVRYRLFSSWGVTPPELARAITFNVLTFWLGFLTLGGLALTLAPIGLPEAWSPAASTVPLGVAFPLLPPPYGAAPSRHRSIRVRGLEVLLPGPRLTAAQMVLSSVDWALAAAAL